MAFKKKKILAIIPSRSGSKQIKNKNLVKISNKTLLEYAIIFAKECGFFDKIIVSTDSKKYKKIIEKNKIQVPFLRPKNISKDTSTDLQFVQHCLKYLHDYEKYKPDFIVHLRPTSPLRKIKHIKKGLSILIKNNNFDSVKSITYSDHSVFKTWFKDKQNLIYPVVKKNKKFHEPFNMPRQLLKNSFQQTALFDIYREKIVSKRNILNGIRIFGFLTEKYIDIDNMEDIKKSNDYLNFFKNFKKFINS